VGHAKGPEEGAEAPLSGPERLRFPVSICAAVFAATMIVEALMMSARTSGARTMPANANKAAASAITSML
jgi:hypothetical protein